jgi:hypothetical protein
MVRTTTQSRFGAIYLAVFFVRQLRSASGGRRIMPGSRDTTVLSSDSVTNFRVLGRQPLPAPLQLERLMVCQPLCSGRVRRAPIARYVERQRLWRALRYRLSVWFVASDTTAAIAPVTSRARIRPRSSSSPVFALLLDRPTRAETLRPGVRRTWQGGRVDKSFGSGGSRTWKALQRLISAVDARLCMTFHKRISTPVFRHCRCLRCNRVFRVPWADADRYSLRIVTPALTAAREAPSSVKSGVRAA